MRTDIGMIAIGLCLGLLAFGCGNGESEEAESRFGAETLERAIFVHNTVGAWQTGEEWRLVPDLWIGVLEGEVAKEFGNLGQIAVDEWGRIYALDRMKHAVQLFDAEGRHVRTIARRGAGPGEIMQPNGIRLAPQGELWIADIGNGRYTVFDSTGAFLRTYRRHIAGYSVDFRGGFDGESLVEAWAPYFIRTDPKTERVDSFVIGDPGAAPPPPETRRYEFSLDGGASTRYIFVPYRPERRWALAGEDLVWSGHSSGYVIALRDLAGDTLLVVTKETTPEPVTDRDVARFLNKYPEHRGQMDTRVIPGHKPFFEYFLVDDRGFLWVSTTPGARPETSFAALLERHENLDVFDPHGRLLGTVQLPPPRALLDRFSAVVDELVASLIASAGPDAQPPPDTTVRRIALEREYPRLAVQAIRNGFLYATYKGSKLQGIVRYRIEGR